LKIRTSNLSELAVGTQIYPNWTLQFGKSDTLVFPESVRL
jgi:hypothetical protein